MSRKTYLQHLADVYDGGNYWLGVILGGLLYQEFRPVPLGAWIARQAFVLPFAFLTIAAINYAQSRSSR